MKKSHIQCKLQCFGSDFRVCDGVAGPEMNSNRLKKIRSLGWPASPLLRKAKLKVAPLELPFVTL